MLAVDQRGHPHRSALGRIAMVVVLTTLNVCYRLSSAHLEMVAELHHAG